MKAEIRHPVPLVATLRGRERILFARASTTVEIPEVAPGAMGPPMEYALETGGYVRTYRVHAGRCWEPWPGELPVVLAKLAAGEPHVRAYPALTPLLAGDVAEGDPYGADLPDPVLAAAREDLTVTARANLRAWVGERFLVVGGVLHMARGMPVLVPGDRLQPVHHHPRGTLRHGPVLEPNRGRGLTRYLDRVGHPPGTAERAFGLERLYGPLYRGDDLDLFVQAAPAALRRIHAAVSADGRAGSGLPSVGGFARDAALGHVGGIPRDRYPGLAADVARALSGIAAALPGGRGPPNLRRLLAYAEEIAVPALPPAPVPAEDAESLGALAHGP